MSNAVVRGGAPAIEVAGSLSDGIFFQNLGTSPIFLGVAPYVSSTACDGVIQAGGTYAVGKGRNVYLYADVDTPVVWNFDSGASADSGNSVSAVVAGSVAVSNTPSVTVPGGVAINGPVAVTGNVGIAGSVSVAGSINVAGGIITSFASQAALGQAQANLASFTSIQPIGLGLTDVSQYQSLIIRAYGDQAFGQDLGLVTIQWFDAYGNYISDDNAGYWYHGTLHWVTPVKGFFARIYVYNLGAGTSFCIATVGASTFALPEYEMTRVPTGGAVGSVMPSNVSSVVANMDPGYGTGFMQGNIPASQQGVFYFGTLARKMNFNFNSGGANVTALLFAKMNGGNAIIYPFGGTAPYATQGEVELPRAPIYLQVNNNTAAVASVYFGLTYQRF